MEVIVKGVDQLSPVMDKIATKSNASMASMKKKFKEAEGSLLAVGASMAVFGAAVVAANIKLLKMASDAAETSSKFAVVFRSVSKEAEAMAKDLSRNYGLSSTAAKQLLGDTGDLLTGFGFTGKAALDLSGEVNKLAVDLASFTNFSGGAEGASAALTKALLGERESVKSLGISILEEDVIAKVALITKQGMIFETERQAKAYATLLIAQEQSKNAIGDYQRTQDQFANKSRELTARLTDLAIVFGEKLLPMATRGISIITGLVEKITDWTERHPILTDILVKFGLALGILVGTGGLIILGAVAFSKIAGAITITKDVLILFSTVLKANTIPWIISTVKSVWAFTTSLSVNLIPQLANTSAKAISFANALKASLIPTLLSAVKAVWAFTASLLANPITWWIIGITAVIAAIVLLWKNWEKVTEFISRSIDWIVEKFKWLGDGIKWIAEKLGIYKEKTAEIVKETDNLKDIVDETKTEINDLAAAEREANTAMDNLGTSTDNLGTSLDVMATKAEEAKTNLNEWGQVIETFDEWVFRLGEENAAMAEKSKIAFETYSDSMVSIKDRIDELTLSEGEYALQTINIVDALKEKREELEENIKAAKLSSEEEKKALEELTEWYNLEIQEIVEKLKEKKDALIEAAKQAELSATEEKATIASVTAAYNEQIETLGDLASAKALSPSGAPVAAKEEGQYVIRDGNNNYIGITGDANALTEAEIAEGWTSTPLPVMKLHEGTWRVDTKVPGGEGIALLKDNEVVSQSTPGGWKGATNQIKLEIQAGAFNITSSRLDEGTIRKAGKWLFDEFYSQCRANNIVLQRG